MEDVALFVVFRGIERLVIEVGAVTAIIMGTLLYRWGVQGQQQIEASGSGFAFALKNAAPGSILATFGMTVLVVGLIRPVEIREATGETQVAAATTLTSKTETHTVSATYASPVERARQEIDLFCAMSELPRERSQAILVERKQVAARLLEEASMPPPSAAFFRRVVDASETGDVTATLSQLSAAARETKLQLAAARELHP